MKKTIGKKGIALLLILITCWTACAVLPRETGVASVAQAAVKLSKKKASLQVTKTLLLKISGTKKKVTWSSSNKKVASVSKTGKVTAKKAGKATITAKVGKKKYTCAVTVKKLTGSLQGLMGKKISKYLDALANKPKYTPNWAYNQSSYETSYFRLITEESTGKILEIQLTSGSKYKLFGIYPGMNKKLIAPTLKKSGWVPQSSDDDPVRAYSACFINPKYPNRVLWVNRFDGIFYSRTDLPEEYYD